MYGPFGMKNYDPAALFDTSAIVEAYQELKPHLQGQPLASIWTVWSDDKDEPCECTPIVLQLGSYRHEICWEKTDDLMLSANTIDVSENFNLYGSDTYPSHWKENALPEFLPLVGQKLMNINLLEAAVNYNPDKGINQLWWPNGVLFIFERETLEVYNTLDCTNMTGDIPAGEECRYVDIW